MRTVNTFWHFAINKNHKKGPKRLFQLRQGKLQVSTVRQATVCFSCGVGAPTISKPHLVCILSNNRHLHQASGVATQYTALGFLHEMPPLLNTVV